MRLILTTLLFGFLSIQQTYAMPMAPPFSEDFESFATCAGSCNASCPLVNGWSNSTTDTAQWITDVSGTSSGSTGPSVDHKPGTSAGKYLYLESSSPCYPNKVAEMSTPAFDFTGITQPTLDFWYHMYGNTMGNLHIDVSTDGGTTFSPDVVPTFTDNLNLWQQKIIDLSAYAGQSNVVIRFRGDTTSSFTSDMAIDNVNVYDFVDTDNDGVSDGIEGMGDKDGDTIVDSADYDPSGYFYDEATGAIISGGSIVVNCDVGTPSFVGGFNGSAGFYQFIVSGVGAPSTCTITPTIPAGYTQSASCVDGGTLDVNPGPAAQNLGSSEVGATGVLADASCGANPFFLSLTINPGDAFVFNNNIPLTSTTPNAIPTLSNWMMFLLTSLLLGVAWRWRGVKL